jgi:hypothetical protein
MNIVELCTKVNLQKFFEVQENESLIAKPHPYFGWLAYEANSGLCRGTIIDLYDVERAETLYHYVTVKHPECLEIKTLYNEKTDWNFKAKVRRHFFWKNVYKLSLAELDRHDVYQKQGDGRVAIKMRQYFTEKGYSGYLDNYFGVLTDDMIRAHPSTEWPGIFKFKKTLLIPSWYAPGHIQSLEVCSSDNIDERQPIYDLDRDIPHGWYGLLDHKVVEAVSDLSCQKGLVWSPMAVPFIRFPLELDQSVTAAICFSMWSNSKDLTYVETPNETVQERSFETYFAENLYKLRKSEVGNLETNIGMSLMDAWLASRKEHTTIGAKKFTKKAEGYFAIVKGQEIAVTDFTVDIIKYTVVNNRLFVELEVCKDGTFYTLSVNNNVLQRSNFVFRLRSEFMKNGIGFVNVDPAFERYLSELIIRFSPTPTIADETPDELKKEKTE